MRRIVVSLLVVTVALLGTAGADDSKRVNPTFAGRVMVSDKRFPLTAKSLADFNARVQKQSMSVFKEDKDKKYMIYFAGFLKAPLNDVEYNVKLYDVTNNKGQQLLATIEQFTDERGQTSLLSKMNLDRKVIGVNKDILMVLESKGKVLASTRFRILGEAEKYTGKVNFSQEEANGKKKLDDDED
jgi:hypothetical protein